MKRSAPNSILPFVGGVVMLVGIFFVCTEVPSLLWERDVRQWSQTRGILERAKVAHDSGPESGSVCRMDVAYRYTVKGRQYTGSTYSEAETEESTYDPYERAAEALRTQQAQSGSILVWYAPGNPARSALSQTPATWGNKLFFGVGVFLILAGIALLLW